MSDPASPARATATTALTSPPATSHTPAPPTPHWYASAMHEIGHLASEQPAEVWLREISAWAWAIKHSRPCALRELAAYSLECLDSYHESMHGEIVAEAVKLMSVVQMSKDVVDEVGLANQKLHTEIGRLRQVLRDVARHHGAGDRVSLGIVLDDAGFRRDW